MPKKASSVRALLVLLIAAGFPAAGVGSFRAALAADARGAQALFDLYDRGDYDAFDRGLASAKDLVGDWRDFEHQAVIFVQASPDPAQIPRRRLVAASAGLELAYAQRESWNRARALMEMGCRLLQQPPPQSQPSSEAPTPSPLRSERWWHLAAASLAQAEGDYRFFLPDDMLPPQAVQTRLPAPSALWLNHGQHAAMRFPDDPGLTLALGIALESKSLAAMTAEDMPTWIPAAGIDQLITSRVPMLLPNMRMDVDSAVKLLKLAPSTPQPAAEKSLRLWNVAARLREATAGPEVAPEAHMRLGHTFLRLAQPEGALVELGRAERSDTTPFVLYLARYFGGVALDRLGRHAEALQAYRGALESVPRAQSATLLLTSALFQQGDRDEAAGLVLRSLRPPLANDPVKYYKAGDAGEQWTARRAQLRRALR